MRLIFVIVILCLISHSQLGMSEVISEHNAQYTALDSARWALQNQSGCVKTKTKQANADRYKAIAEGGRYFVEGGRLEIICISGGRMKLTWKAPTERVDESELPESQIAGYDILKDGKPLDFVQCCEYVIDSIQGISIRTVDVTGMVSEEVQF